ncbi:MAG: hypothetical protein F6K22_22215 [Okeania sp. SIO2F4]|uniref:hypothetical protein n=1 Tax=Okeania sp. SIO2F4 TaxID=2607790 RepID=UPI001429FCA3|nr:hypothetical protein [Okeania sp. SIO2F4]NES05295.1 hypothetical protein [Okeania sp. SIO2F4]
MEFVKIFAFDTDRKVVTNSSRQTMNIFAKFRSMSSGGFARDGINFLSKREWHQKSEVRRKFANYNCENFSLLILFVSDA